MVKRSGDTRVKLRFSWLLAPESDSERPELGAVLRSILGELSHLLISEHKETSRKTDHLEG